MYNLSFLLSIYVTSFYDLLEIIQNVVVQCKTLHHFALSSTRNRFCWPGRAASVSRAEICLAWRNFKWHLKKYLEGVRVTSNYNGLCCIPLKLSPSSLKKTIHFKKDFDSVYNWMFWTYTYGAMNVSISRSIIQFRDRAEGGAGGALAFPLFCKNKNKLNKK